MGGPWDAFGALGGIVGETVVNGWIGLMLGIWGAGTWVLRWVLEFTDALLQPQVSADGPARNLYLVAYAIGVGLAVTLSLVQVEVALVRRDGRSVGRLLVGVGQFWLILVGGIAYAQVVLTAASALTRGLMPVLLGVDAWQKLEPGTFGLGDITDAGLATVLGMMAIFLVIPAAVAFFVIMVGRSVALLVLVASSPIAAAGLVADVGHTWFWKLCRWFHALAFTPLVVVFVLGIGMQVANGVASGRADDAARSVGTAVASVILIAVSAFAPMALFRLLAFVDPGTTSGAAARIGWEASGGLQGLIRGKGSAQATSGAASQQTADGSSQGEGDAQASTNSRVGTALAAFTGRTPSASGSQPGTPSVGQQAAQPATGQQASGQQGSGPSWVDRGRGMLAGGLGAFTTVGGQWASIGSDVTNQAGVGNTGYYPDFTGSSPRRSDQGQIAHQAGQQQSAGSTPQPANGAAQPALPVHLPPPGNPNPPTSSTGGPST